MNLAEVKRVYFVGIGGIGMSALARYFMHKGLPVAGYDRVASDITRSLEQQGSHIHYTDSISSIPPEFLNSQGTLVIYTPAVPPTHTELSYFRANGFNLMKRAQVLGLIASGYRTLAVAGTHGKTTTSTLLAHLLSTELGCDAFLGGISRNFESNLVLADRGNNLMVVEADEYDRSFLQLYPELAIITSVDADHLDIYGTHEAVIDAFRQFTSQIKPNGTLVVKQELAFQPRLDSGVKLLTYGFTPECDYYPINIRIDNGLYGFTLVTPNGSIENLELGVPGRYNLENAIAASAAALALGLSVQALSKGLRTFRGVQRRFDVRFRGAKSIYIDDYAHHPKEIEALIRSVRDVFPCRHITGIFQPHLYSRTRDFADGFAAALDMLDQAVITEIYPARELPIEGVSSATIIGLMQNPNVLFLQKMQILAWLKDNKVDVLLTMGAGDIDRLVNDIAAVLAEKEK